VSADVARTLECVCRYAMSVDATRTHACVRSDAAIYP
jgi:hypothetical protein